MMYYKALALLFFAVPVLAADVPDHFEDTFSAIKWACDNINEAPNLSCIETPGHQAIVMWGVPDKAGKTPVLTLIKNNTDPLIPFVRYEKLSAWQIDLEGEPTEHFGLIQYDKGSDLLTYHTNVKRQLLLRSLPVAECYDSAIDNR